MPGEFLWIKIKLKQSYLEILQGSKKIVLVTVLKLKKESLKPLFNEK